MRIPARSHAARSDVSRMTTRTLPWLRPGEEPLRRLLRRGSFTEDVLGAFMLKQAKRGGLQTVRVPTAPPRGPSGRGRGEPAAGSARFEEVSRGVLDVAAEYGGWIHNLEDPQGFLIFHIDSAGPSVHHALHQSPGVACE